MDINTLRKTIELGLLAGARKATNKQWSLDNFHTQITVL